MVSVSVEWDTEIVPLVEDICRSVESSVVGGGTTAFFRELSPVDLYTKIYEMTARHRGNFESIDFMHTHQTQAVARFCGRFVPDGLVSFNKQFEGIGLLVRWFGCFFHHLNIFRRRVYGDCCPTTEQDMADVVRAHYLHPHKHALFSWLRVAWSVRAATADAVHAVRAVATCDPAIHSRIVVLYLSCLRDHYKNGFGTQGNDVEYMRVVVDCFDRERVLFLTHFPTLDPSDVEDVLREVLVLPCQDVLVKTWGTLVGGEDVAGARVFARFFFWSTCQESWVSAHKSFAAARVRSARNIGGLDAFLRSQMRLLHDVFERDGRRRAVFVRVVEAAIREAFTPATTAQWVKDAHRRLSSKRPAAMLGLIGFCPDKDDLYRHHHALLRIRLLSNSFEAVHENAVLGVFQKAFGASFVINMRLMLEENADEKMLGSCGVKRISRVAWDIGTNALQFQPPPAVVSALSELQARWREKTNPSVRLELLPLEGSVHMTSGHVMSPPQAIVLLALGAVPIARRDLVSVLNVPDDDAHNITGILRSLEKAGLVIRRDDDQWCQSAVPPPPSTVPPPPSSPSVARAAPEWATAAVEAFIVRKLKKEKRTTFAALCRALTPDVPACRIRELVDGLARREYLEWHGTHSVAYLP